MNSFLNKFSITKLDLFVLLVIAILGIINLPTPFGGDQALFITGAQEMAKGKVLYRDFWDFKTPGIFYFYNFAGSLFGFTEIGIHLFELFFWFFLSLFMIIVFKSSNTFENKSSASLAPLFTVGLYYSFSSAFTLTQVEGIINIFLFSTLWLALEALKSVHQKNLLMFLSGLLGSLVLMFKLMFLPILGSFWLTVFLTLIFKRKEKSGKIIKQFLFPLFAGLFIPTIILIIYYLKMGILETVYKTLFIYPPRLLSEIPLGSSAKLYDLFWKYINTFYPILSLATLGIFISVWRKKDLITINLFLWLIFGIVIIILTRISWWEYHLHLLNIPIGIFSLIAIDFIWSAIKKYNNSWKSVTASIITLLILFLPTFRAISKKAKFFSNYTFAQSYESRKEILATFDGNYKYSFRNINILTESHSLPGSIWVAGNPLFYYLSGRSQAVQINGWVLELLLPEQWSDLIKQLRKNRPVYIFFDVGYVKLVPNLSPEIVNFIKKNYSIVNHTRDGIWFVDKEKLKH